MYTKVHFEHRIQASHPAGLLALLVSLLCTLPLWAEAPPAGPEDTKEAPRSSRSRNFNSRVTMHNVGLGRVDDLQKEGERPRTLDFGTQGNASFFEEGGASSYPLPVSPNQPRPRKGKEEKKRSADTATPIVAGYPLQASIPLTVGM